VLAPDDGHRTEIVAIRSRSQSLGILPIQACEGRCLLPRRRPSIHAVEQYGYVARRLLGTCQ
jgi:hypothetical protein